MFKCTKKLALITAHLLRNTKFSMPPYNGQRCLSKLQIQTNPLKITYKSKKKSQTITWSLCTCFFQSKLKNLFHENKRFSLGLDKDLQRLPSNNRTCKIFINSISLIDCHQDRICMQSYP